MSLKEFPIIQKLGEGAYSSVYKVKRQTDENEYALKKVKLMNLSDKEKQNALNEVRILASIRQPNIIGYKEAFVDESSNSLCIVMEYADNGDLYQKIVEFQKKGQLLPEQEIWNIFIQIVKGLKALHGLHIYHRDLKSANVFLTKESVVKLGDMNVSKVAKQGLLYTQTGTPYYASPEVWKDQAYDSKSDIWSLGCVLYEMTTLKPPFRAEDMEGLYKKVIRGYYPRIPPHFSQDLANVIRALLQVAPNLRPSCDKILSMPAVVKRINDNLLMEVDEQAQINLLNTIKIPKNLHYLTDRLPKPNYEPLRTKRVDKRKFLQTLAGYRDIPTNEESPTPSPEQMKQLVLPKIPVARKNNHAVQSTRNDDENDRVSEASLILPDENVSSTSQPHRAHPRSLSRKNVNKYDSNNTSIHSSSLQQSQQQNQQQPQQHQSQHSQSSQQQQQQQQQQSGKQSSAAPQNYYSEAARSEAPSTKQYSKAQENLPPKQHHQQHLQPDKYSEQQSQLPQGQINKLKKKEISPIKKKRINEGMNLLDIEGESKPLLSKGKRQNNHSIDNSIIYDDARSVNTNKLPAIQGTKLPRIGGPPISSGLGLGIVGQNNGLRSLELENAKIKEITKAYKVNLDPINDLKDRYRQLKKNDRSKQDSNKTSSVPPISYSSIHKKYEIVQDLYPKVHDGY